MSVCSNSCIGCGLCQKECKKDAIHVVNGVAVIDYDKCVGCKLCTKVCLRDAILPVATAEEKEKVQGDQEGSGREGCCRKGHCRQGCRRDCRYRSVSVLTFCVERKCPESLSSGRFFSVLI